MHPAAAHDDDRHLDECHDAGADHHAVRHICLGDVAAGNERGEPGVVEQQRRIAADQQADAEHGQRPDVADECHAERRHDGGRDQPVAGDADDDADTEDHRFAPAFVAGADCLGGGGTGRPRGGGGEHLGIEHAIQQIAVEQHRQEHAGEQRGHQVGTAEHERDADRQHQCIAGAEGGGGDRALRQVLHVDRAIADERAQRDARQCHARERADQRGVGGDAERDDELHADDRTDDAERRDQQQRAEFEEARVDADVRGAVVGRSVARSLIVCPHHVGTRRCR